MLYSDKMLSRFFTSSHLHNLHSFHSISFVGPWHAYRGCKVQVKDVDLCLVLSDEAGPTANQTLPHIHPWVVINLHWITRLTWGWKKSNTNSYAVSAAYNEVPINNLLPPTLICKFLQYLVLRVKCQVVRDYCSIHNNPVIFELAQHTNEQHINKDYYLKR